MPLMNLLQEDYYFRFAFNVEIEMRKPLFDARKALAIAAQERDRIFDEAHYVVPYSTVHTIHTVRYCIGIHSFLVFERETSQLEAALWFADEDGFGLSVTSQLSGEAVFKSFVFPRIEFIYFYELSKRIDSGDLVVMDSIRMISR